MIFIHGSTMYEETILDTLEFITICNDIIYSSGELHSVYNYHFSDPVKPKDSDFPDMSDVFSPTSEATLKNNLGSCPPPG